MGLDNNKIIIREISSSVDMMNVSMVLDETVSGWQVLMMSLADHGVDVIFSAPNSNMIDSGDDAYYMSLRYVSARHEGGAVFMADGFAHVAGRPAICLLPRGAGLLNAMTAIAHAYSNSVPIIVLTIVDACSDLDTGCDALRNMQDTLSIMEGFAERVIRIRNVEQISGAVDLSFARMAAQRCRPIVIELPSDVMRSVVVVRHDVVPFISRPAPTPSVITELHERLVRAKRPFFIFGGGALGATQEARQLVELLGAPCVSTVAGKGVVDESSPLSLGANLGHEAVNLIMNDADLVIAVGTELSYQDHYNKPLAITADLVRIDIDPDVLVREHLPAMAVLADVGLTLQALLGVLKLENPRKPWKDDVIKISENILKERRRSHPDLCLYIDVLRKELPSDAVIFSDKTKITDVASHYFLSHEPGCWLYPTAFDTQGYALPAAMGGKFAAPERRIVAFLDEHGFGYTQQELTLAVEQRLSLPIIIWSSHYWEGDGAGGGDVMALESLDYMALRFDDLARAYGVRYECVTQPDVLGDALEKAFDVDGPTLIEIRQAKSVKRP